VFAAASYWGFVETLSYKFTNKSHEVPSPDMPALMSALSIHCWLVYPRSNPRNHPTTKYSYNIGIIHLLLKNFGAPVNCLVRSERALCSILFITPPPDVQSRPGLAGLRHGSAGPQDTLDQFLLRI